MAVRKVSRVAANTSSRLLATSDLIDLTTSLDLTSPGLFCESNQALFQILLPRACSSLTYLFIHFKLQHALHLCLSSSFHLFLIQFQPSVYVIHRAVVQSKLLSISLTQLIDQSTHVQAWTNCSHFTLVIGISCTERRRADLHWLFVTRTGWLCTGLWTDACCCCGSCSNCTR